MRGVALRDEHDFYNQCAIGLSAVFWDFVVQIVACGLQVGVVQSGAKEHCWTMKLGFCWDWAVVARRRQEPAKRATA